METEHVLPFSAVSVVEDVLQQQGARLSDFYFASRKTEEASLRRYEAAGWLRKTVGVVGGKDLPAEPSEEAFRIGLRSGIILCNVLNKIQPGAVPKVVEAPGDSVLIPDGAALSAYQYFENVRNFLVAVEEMGLPPFEFSDLEQGGKASRIVNCVLALKSYAEWKLGGGNGSWKYGVPKPPTSGKPILRKNSEPFMKSLWTMSPGDRDGYMSDHSSYSDPGHERNEEGSYPSLNSLVRQYLYDKKPDEIPIVVECLLSKVIEEFEHRMQMQKDTSKTTQEDKASSEAEYPISISKAASVDEDVDEEMGKEEDGVDLQDKQEDEVDLQDKQEDEVDLQDKQEGGVDLQDKQEDGVDLQDKQEEDCDEKAKDDEELRIRVMKQQELAQQQDRSIQELKNIVHQTKSGVQFLQMEYQKEIIYLSKHMHSLASAASGYHKVLEENRKLYNQVQDLKGNIRVYCRVRPFLGGQPSHYSAVSNVEEGSISLVTPAKYGKEGKKTFNFNRVFGSCASQEEVFSDTQPLIRSIIDGYNVCIFAYGQTGSGKTYTMSGPDDLTEETIGVNYRALKDLFILSEQRKDVISYEIKVQMLEIYNEQVRDLLATDGSNKRLEIRNSSHNGINVPEASLVPVSSTSDVINLMNLGHKNRTVGATAMNDRSSRSHSCLTVHVQGRNLTSGSTIRGSMHLVDLAGSERADKSEATGDRLKEAQHINKSLSALGDVISSLAQKNSHVPYRNSKLTQLLQDSLGGQAKTLMFVHISPEPEALGETLSTLKFAERVSMVELGAARTNKDNAQVYELRDQIATLKAALAKKEGEAEHFPTQSVNSGHETPKLKSNISSPPTPIQHSMEGKKKSATKLKRRSLDLHDMYKRPPSPSPWPHVSINKVHRIGKEDDKEFISGDWVDKFTMNRNDSLTSDDSLVSQWEEESKQFSPLLSPSSLSEPSKLYLEHSSHKKDSPEFEELYRPGCEMAITDESDELEIATSDSSESEMNWLSHAAKPIGLSNGSSSKTKKSTNLRPTKSLETRSMIPSLIPTPTRKQPTVVNQARKQQGSVAAKKRTGNGI